jgi:uncharacterized repeat protein (TIGR02543 family)
MQSVTPSRLLPFTLLILMAWCNLALAADTPADTAGAATATPLAELGQRADAQSPAPVPVLADGQATLAAPLQALRGEISPAGLTVESTSVSEGGGRFRLTPTQLGKGGTPLSLSSGAVSLRDQAVVLDRGPLTEVLSASGDGLRQDFVIPQAPAGDGPLALTLALEGATASADPAGIALTLPGGRRLVYGGLHITDAAGQVVDGALAVADGHTLMITVADADARYPLTIDPTISDADWRVMNPEIPEANGQVLAIAYDSANNKLYVGGALTATGAILVNNIAQWDGSAWSALGSGVEGGDVYALAVSGSDLYVGGGFTTAGGSPANNIAKWDGSAWSALGSGLNGWGVYALAVSGSDLYVGGFFTTAGGNSANSIAKWDGSAWSALGSGLNGGVKALAVSGSDLYVGGSFTTAGGNAVNKIAKWNGSAWYGIHCIGVYSHNFNSIYALAMSGGHLYVSGQTNKEYVNHVSDFVEIDQSYICNDLGRGISSDAYAMAVSGSNLYVGGSGGNLAKWDGNTWSALGSGLVGGTGYPGTNVTALAVSGNDLYVGGTFSTAGGNAASSIAKWNGSTWSAFGSGGLSGQVKALAVSGSNLYVGGENLIAKWDGSTWSALGSGLNATVNALAVSGSDLYVGGWFTTAGGNAANHIAKWDGSTWSALGSGLGGGTGYYGTNVTALAVSGTDLYVGGDFTTAGGNAANYIAKWNGSTWSALGSGVNGGLSYTIVYALAVSGSDLYVGGEFTTAGGSEANNIAKWDGSTWSTLGGDFLDYPVSALAVSDTDLYVGCLYGRIAKWNGSTWSALGSGLSGWAIYALAVSGNDLYVGGEFTTAGGNAANSIAKWDGSAWSALGSGLSGGVPYTQVYALAVSGSNQLYVGGNFSAAGGKFSPYLAAVNLAPGTYNITATAEPAGGGTASCTPNPVNHGSDSTCTATANPGYTFTAWSGDCTGTTCVLSNVTAAKSVTANFTLKTYAITTTAEPVAAGTVNCVPNPVNHGSNSTCTATANAGYFFSSGSGDWSGDCIGTTCVLSNVTAAKSVTANFTLKTHFIKTAAEPVAGGTVNCVPNPVYYGSNSTCTATANAGYTFTAWSGDCTGATCVLNNVTAFKTVTANFTQTTPTTYAITTTAEPLAGGIVNCVPNPVNHGSDSTCTATANPSYTFTAWSGDCTGATCVLNNVTAAKTVTANFTACQTGPLTLDGTTFGPGDHTRSSATAIVTQGSVTLQAGAAVTFRAPLQRLGPGFRVATGATFHGRAEAVTCSAASRVASPSAAAPTAVSTSSTANGAPAAPLTAPLPFSRLAELPEWLQQHLGARGLDARALTQGLRDPLGQWLLVETTQGLDPRDGNAASDLYRLDLTTDAFTLLSRTPTGQAGHGPSRYPATDASGDWVVFESAADDLEAGDDNGVTDIFLHEVPFGTVRRVTTGTAQTAAHPTLDAAGQDLLYDQRGLDGQRSIVTTRLWGETPAPLAPRPDGTGLPPDRHHPAISADGRFIAYLEEDRAGAGCQVGLHDRDQDRHSRQPCPAELAAASDTARPFFSADGTQIEWHRPDQDQPVSVPNRLLTAPAGITLR